MNIDYTRSAPQVRPGQREEALPFLPPLSGTRSVLVADWRTGGAARGRRHRDRGVELHDDV